MMRHRAVVFLWCGLALLAGLFSTYGYLPTWRLWNLPAAWPAFMDARVITAAAETYRSGGDPLVGNPTDSARRPLNYPRIWHTLYALGIGERDSLGLALAFVAVFLAALSVFLWRAGPAPAWPLLVTFFSPAVLLGIERGNTDLVVFAIVAAAVLSMRRRPWLALVLVLFAFVLKLYPLAAIGVLLGGDRRTARRTLTAAAAFAVLYLLFIWDDLALISAGTPRDSWISYGRGVIGTKLAGLGPAWGVWAGRASLAIVAGLLGWAVFAARRSLGRTGHRVPESLPLDGFRAGACCYVGTFVAGYSFDYRLMFLLLTVPQLSAWLREGDARSRRLAWIAVVALIGATWNIQLDRLCGPSTPGAWSSFLIGEAAAWVLFGAVLLLFAQTLPGWLGAPAEQPTRGAAPAAGRASEETTA